MIEFENVSFSYTGQEHGGLRDINLKISDGEFVLFCGRSGCGKTTITRLVNGLIPQFYQGELHGRVLVDGQKISNIPMYQIAAKVGSVFQNPRTQFFNVDTDSEIAFGIENEARPPEKLAERVEQTTEDLHIQKLRNRNIFELSGGEKQKIAFASVYAAPYALQRVAVYQGMFRRVPCAFAYRRTLGAGLERQSFLAGRGWEEQVRVHVTARGLVTPAAQFNSFFAF